MKIRRKIGLLYWKVIGKWRSLLYKTKRVVKSVWIWLCGFLKGNSIPSVIYAQDIIVCAHPDDETIFFSSALKSTKPFVVCVSHRGDKVRRDEFYKALAYWGVDGIMLNFPDVPGMALVWRWRMCAVLARLRKSMPLVSTVYTHSSCGESGHPHHYAVSTGVRKAFNNCRIVATAATIPESGEGRLKEAEIEEKYSVIKYCYPSQINMLEKWCSWWQDYLTVEYFEG